MYFCKIIADKCIKITGYDLNFKIEKCCDYLEIKTDNLDFQYSGESGPDGIKGTTRSLVGIISRNEMNIFFER